MILDASEGYGHQQIVVIFNPVKVCEIDRAGEIDQYGNLRLFIKNML